MIYIVITILAALIAILSVLALTSNRRMKAKALACAKEAKVFHDRLYQLCDPSHFFTDEEAVRLKKEFTPLLHSVNKLYNSPLISNDYLDGLGLLLSRHQLHHQSG